MHLAVLSATRTYTDKTSLRPRRTAAFVAAVPLMALDDFMPHL
jgi:hypothetical protein